MFGCRSSAEIFASRMNIVLKSPVSDSRGRMRLSTSSRSNPSGPGHHRPVDLRHTPLADPAEQAEAAEVRRAVGSGAVAGPVARLVAGFALGSEPSRSALDDVAASAGLRTGIGGFIDSFRS